jgi:hypothetical protein
MHSHAERGNEAGCWLVPCRCRCAADVYVFAFGIFVSLAVVEEVDARFVKNTLDCAERTRWKLLSFNNPSYKAQRSPFRS